MSNLLTLYIMNKFILKSFSLILLSLSLVGCFGNSSTNPNQSYESKPNYEGYYRFDWGGRPLTLHLMNQDPDSDISRGTFELYGSTVSGTIRGKYFVQFGNVLVCSPSDHDLRPIFMNIKYHKAGSESGYLWWTKNDDPADIYDLSHESCCKYYYTRNN